MKKLRIDIQLDKQEFLVMPWFAKEAEELYGEIGRRKKVKVKLSAVGRRGALVSLRQSRPW